jgi:hypothetical protein
MPSTPLRPDTGIRRAAAGVRERWSLTSSTFSCPIALN